MNKKGLIVFILLSAATLYILHQANPYREFSELSRFNGNSYTFYMTSGGVEETIIKNHGTYYFASNGTTYLVKGMYLVEEYLPAGRTTVVKTFYLNVPFSKCNFADPLISGTIIMPTDDTFTSVIGMEYVYNLGRCVFPPMSGAGTLVGTITGDTMRGRIIGYGITFTLIG